MVELRMVVEEKTNIIEFNAGRNGTLLSMRR